MLNSERNGYLLTRINYNGIDVHSNTAHSVSVSPWILHLIWPHRNGNMHLLKCPFDVDVSNLFPTQLNPQRVCHLVGDHLFNEMLADVTIHVFFHFHYSSHSIVVTFPSSVRRLLLFHVLIPFAAIANIQTKLIHSSVLISVPISPFHATSLSSIHDKWKCTDGHKATLCQKKGRFDFLFVPSSRIQHS